MQIISKNESNSRNQNQNQKSKSTTNEEKFENRFKQIYVVNEIDEKFDEIFQKQQKKKQTKYHVTNENLDYYNIEKNFHEKNEIFVNFTFEVVKISRFRCRRCRKTFSFNNNFHRHLRDECSIQNYFVDVSNISFSFSINQSFFFIDVIKKSSTIDTAVFDNMLSTFNTIVIAIFDDIFNVIIIHFNVDVFVDVDIDYDFRN